MSRIYKLDRLREFAGLPPICGVRRRDRVLYDPITGASIPSIRDVEKLAHLRASLIGVLAHRQRLLVYDLELLDIHRLKHRRLVQRTLRGALAVLRQRRAEAQERRGALEVPERRQRFDPERFMVGRDAAMAEWIHQQEAAQFDAYCRTLEAQRQPQHFYALCKQLREARLEREAMRVADEARRAVARAEKVKRWNAMSRAARDRRREEARAKRVNACHHCGLIWPDVPGAKGQRSPSTRRYCSGRCEKAASRARLGRR